MDKIKIFLASSSDLKEERDEFSKHINLINKQWEGAGVAFELVIWEQLLGTISDTRKQNDYNEAVKGCDIFVLLFFDRVGEYTLEEFNVAFGQFKATGKPVILTYFKSALIDTKNLTREVLSLIEFKEKLDSLGHFWLEYKNVHQLILDFYMQLNELANKGFFGSRKIDRLDASVVIPKELTLAMPKTHPKDIIGRDKELDNLHELLSTDKRVVVVNGLGGVGKTTLAQAYLSKYYDEYHHIGWIAQSSDNIASDFINAAGLLDHLDIAAKGTDIEELFSQLIGKLKGIPSRPNLLIIDNATESLEKYFDILPTQPHWHLLVTSREKIEGFYVLPLDFLSEREAITLFKKYYTGKKLSDEDIKTLVAAVDYHTLTIEILAKTATAQRYELDVLLQAIKKNVKSSAKVSRDRQLSSIEKVGSYLQSVFNISNLEEMELWLMKQFACLPGEFHTYNSLQELIVGVDKIYDEVLPETLATLSQRGWLLYNTEIDAYKMHRVIAGVFRKEYAINVSDINALLENIVRNLKIDWDKDNPVDKFVWKPYGEAILENFSNSTEIEIAELQNNLAQVVQDFGDYERAKTLFEVAIKTFEKHFGPDNPVTAATYSNLSIVLQELGKYAEAKLLLEKAVESDKTNFGEDHTETVTSTTNLAALLELMGDHAAARVLLERAIEWGKRDFGEDHPVMATRYSNLGMVLKNLDQLQQAKTLLEKALSVDKKHYGENHPYVAKDYSNLAQIYFDLKDYKTTKLLLDKALEIDEKNFGAGHPVTGRRYLNLATILMHTKDFSEALEFCEKALTIFDKTLPENHPHVEMVKKTYQSIKEAMRL